MKHQDPKIIEKQLMGYRLSTAEILYRLPDHPVILQSFIWQHYDLAPEFPELRRFLDFWVREIEGKIFRVTVGTQPLIGTAEARYAKAEFTLH